MTSYRVLDSQPPIERPRVTVADNRNVDFRIVIVLILCSFVASVILGVAAYLLTGWPAPVIVIADMVLLYRFSKWLIPQLTGDAVALQERGLGTRRTLGCGLFIAHKSINKVNSE